jgi:hypothetical protein
MTADRHDPGLELEDDETFHGRVWRLRRAGRLAMVLLILVGMAGLLGPGLLSRTEVSDARGLRVEHARFARAEAPESLRVRIPAQADGHRLAVSRAFLDRVRIESVVPEPIRTEALGDQMVYVFVGPPGAEAVATFHFTPHAIGFARAALGAPGLVTLSIWMIVYP